MRWKAEDMEQMIGMEEYVDTLVYPVCVLGTCWDINWVKQQLWLERVCGYVERQLTGRLFLFQPLSVISKKESSVEIACDFIAQNIYGLIDRFPHCLVVTNDSAMSTALMKKQINTYIVSAPPEEKTDSKTFLEKARHESDRLVKHCIALWL
ncbi:DUF2487 family protein [Aneurinibacillus thermoaerophilus]|jgi:hypothetical protein|uniref:DUF2487 family protein n=1 Tax=Aneurinibacillus thermoaerophilus TaxID=143495 RepID=UPI002E23DE14|nr:DUF2487 family protein [Aneurinibacillus thermoaerophilus]MED0679656.1 DUF2487 family protein [Aneurinibacillus thermoaerophilus]MED0737346.1 DUF2487 family protein [Aneurinibacillus thermoaerophilus]MED0764918.1 DUF2487 family protein [Aneurinibacillus thermoaerophilus]